MAAHSTHRPHPTSPHPLPNPAQRFAAGRRSTSSLSSSSSSYSSSSFGYRLSRTSAGAGLRAAGSLNVNGLSAAAGTGGRTGVGAGSESRSRGGAAAGALSTVLHPGQATRRPASSSRTCSRFPQDGHTTMIGKRHPRFGGAGLALHRGEQRANPAGERHGKHPRHGAEPRTPRFRRESLPERSLEPRLRSNPTRIVPQREQLL